MDNKKINEEDTSLDIPYTTINKRNIVKFFEDVLKNDISKGESPIDKELLRQFIPQAV